MINMKDVSHLTHKLFWLVGFNVSLPTSFSFSCSNVPIASSFRSALFRPAMMGDVQSTQSGQGGDAAGFKPFQPGMKPRQHQITDDYKISKNVLGVGINGKVVECIRRKTNEKFALKVSLIAMILLLNWANWARSYLQVLRDVPKARRELELHWMASNHKNIVRIYDVFENVYNGIKCLLVVMEW